MGVELGLEHADLGLVELLLVLHQLLLVVLEGHQHLIEPLGQLPQLVVVLMGHIHVQVVACHRLDGPVDALDGAEHLAAQGQAHEDGDDHADEGAGEAHGIHEPHGVPVEDLGLP